MAGSPPPPPPSSSHSPSPSSSLPTTGRASASFRSLPQKYPRAQRQASQVAQAMHDMLKKGPRSLVAQVVDTSFQLTMGYVLCSTQLGVVKVYGVPYAAAVAQMRLYTRQIGPHGTNRDYVFDGWAPAPSVHSQTSGALLLSQTTGDSLAVPAATAPNTVPTVSGLSSAVGYYWHCFFYVPQLPTTTGGRVTLWCLNHATASNVLCLDYLSSGQLVLRSAENNDGYITTGPVAPHVIHWLLAQPGVPGGGDLLVDGVSAWNYLSLSTGPSFWGDTNAYTLSLLSKYDGTQACQPGTWVSKFGFGTSITATGGAGTVLPLTSVASAPASDAALPNLAASSAQETIARYLMTNAGSGILSNSGAGSDHAGNVVTNTGAPYATQVGPGPY